MTYSRNEWDTLKKVIVGRADDAKIPLLDPSLRLINYADRRYTYNIPTGPYPKQVIAEANEDLETLVNFLQGESVEVLRPNVKEIPNYYNYCPRDTIMAYDDKIISPPMALRARRNEWMAYHGVVDIIHLMGRPIGNNLYNSQCLGNPDILALNDTEPCFDAANVLRSNDDLYYLVSNTGNKKGAELLQSYYPNSTVHTIEGVYSYIHIKPLRNWDVIWAPEPVDIGHYPGYCNASTWVSINLLSVNPNLVVLEEHQHNLRTELEKHNIECAMLPMRHARTLGGCFHCVTVDLERE